MIRRLEPADLKAAAAVSAAAFGLDLSNQDDRTSWQDRVAHAMRTDPEGGFVAELDGQITGVAQALVREGLWCLTLLTVSPGAQSRGAGRALLTSARSYGAETGAAIIVSSSDPRAMRLYGLAGFSLLPTFSAHGTVARSAMPRLSDEVREGDSGDLEALAPISREIRGAAHTTELAYALRRGGRLLLVDGRGFTVVTPGQNVWLLVARDESAARSLLWSALGAVGDTERPAVRWITAQQDWAIDVVLRAGLRLATADALAVAGNPGPLRPFIPSGPFA